MPLYCLIMCMHHWMCFLVNFFHPRPCAITFKLDVKSKLNWCTKYLGQRSFGPKVVARTKTNTHPTDCTTWTIKEWLVMRTNTDNNIPAILTGWVNTSCSCVRVRLSAFENQLNLGASPSTVGVNSTSMPEANTCRKSLAISLRTFCAFM